MIREVILSIKQPEGSKKFFLNYTNQELIFFCPEDQDTIINQITDEECKKDTFFPYWAEHWPSSEVFFAYCSNQFPKHYKNICELGAGLGVISAILVKKGNNIITTDISYQSCIYSSANILNHECSNKTVCCDWRHSPFKQKFDCILASDILYEKRFIEPVIKFLKSNLTQNGHAYIADPCRSYWNFFKSEIVFKGFKIEEVQKEKVNDNKTTIEIIKIGFRN